MDSPAENTHQAAATESAGQSDGHVVAAPRMLTRNATRKGL